MGRLLAYMSAVFTLFLNACVTSPDTHLTLEDALEGKIALSLPMEVTERGLIVIKDVKIDDRSLDMILDTGATHSAVFQSAFDRLDLVNLPNSETMVHGMLDSKSHRVVSVSELKLGSVRYSNKPMIVLDNQELDFRKFDTHDGVIGMDILSDYQLYIMPDMQELKLIPRSKSVSIPPSWPRIDLMENPFQSDNRSLHFLNIRVGGRVTPALLDTGSEFNSLNWAAANYAQTRAFRKKLRKEWEVQGAVGVFSPRAHVKLGAIRSGQVSWDEKDFMILDYDSLEVLGFDNDPFMIAGMNFFYGESIFIDFDRDFLAVDPNSR